MKNKLNQLFESKKENLLSIYFSAGFPELESTKKIISTLSTSGVDFIEVGIPFSDPLADGPTIQKSSSIALENGMSLKLLFEQLYTIKETNTTPLIMMGYWNSVLQFGVENFLKTCVKAKISGAILPDLPLEIYEQKYQTLFESYNIPMVFLITSQTSEERIRKIDKFSKAFIYAVSSSSTTGNKTGIEGAKSYLQRIKSYQLKNPIITGFNIKNKADYQFACQFTQGVVIGSAFIKAIQQKGSLEKNIVDFISEFDIKPRNL
ncbi:MAG: tryptophan synthase subunit alpha [Flavobacterium sp.]|nr:MAG: tryptophan synthase subunit alpha [Flavobacterium sp.]